MDTDKRTPRYRYTFKYRHASHTPMHNTPAHSDEMLSTPDIPDVQLVAIANTMTCDVPAPM